MSLRTEGGLGQFSGALVLGHPLLGLRHVLALSLGGLSLRRRRRMARGNETSAYRHSGVCFRLSDTRQGELLRVSRIHAYPQQETNERKKRPALHRSDTFFHGLRCIGKATIRVIAGVRRAASRAWLRVRGSWTTSRFISIWLMHVCPPTAPRRRKSEELINTGHVSTNTSMVRAAATDQTPISFTHLDESSLSGTERLHAARECHEEKSGP